MFPLLEYQSYKTGVHLYQISHKDRDKGLRGYNNSKSTSPHLGPYLQLGVWYPCGNILSSALRLIVTGDWDVPFTFNSLMGKQDDLGSGEQIKWTWSHSSKSEHIEICSVGKKQIQVHLIYSPDRTIQIQNKKENQDFDHQSRSLAKNDDMNHQAQLFLCIFQNHGFLLLLRILL